MRAAKTLMRRKSGGKVEPKSDADHTKKKPARAEPIVAEGAAGRPRLDRPGRRRADGGGVSRISEDSRRAVDELRDRAGGRLKRASDEAGAGVVPAAIGLGMGLLGRSRLARVAGPSIAAGAVGADVLNSAGHVREALADRAEADRIERGEAEPGREDRKHGGKVRRR